MPPLFTAAERIGWAVAVVVVAVMGWLAFHGPFHLVNKPAAAAHYPPVTVRWMSDPRIVARNVPDPIRVHVGQSVTWVNDSNAPHTATARDQSFNSGFVGIGSSWTYRPQKAGTFKYYCLYHPLMHGILIVSP